MTPLTRLCLVSSLGLFSLVPAFYLASPSDAQGQTYVVQANDTLSGIAMRFHTSQWRLSRMNGIGNPDQLRAGQMLQVPDGAEGGWELGGPPAQTALYDGAAPATYVKAGTATSPMATGAAMSYIVVRGDTLGVLSTRFGASIATLAAMNGIARPDMLTVGARLLIPVRGTTTTYASETSQLPVTPAISTAVPGNGQTSTSVAPAASVLPATQSSVGTLLASQAQAYGLSPALVKAVAWQESGWRMVTAVDGGIGVMQLMPATAAWVGPALLGRTIDPYNLTDNIQAGVALLASYMRQYGDVHMALAAYNEGPQNLARGILSTTARYIANVLALQANFG